MPDGKPAGVRCIQLDETNLCMLFERLERPKVCQAFKAERAICGDSSADAIKIIGLIEGG